MSATPFEVVPCSSFEDFVAKVRPRNSVFYRAFRGQRDVNWKLQSQFERWLDGKLRGQGPHDFDLLFQGGRDGRIKFAQHQLDRFRELVNGFPDAAPDLLKDDLQLWALGRHHGLITPLLDWSESPYIAAFFAMFDRLDSEVPDIRKGAPSGISVSPEPVAVWELQYDSTIIRPGEFEVITLRRADARRQRAQAGLFSYLMDVSAVALDDYIASKGHSRHLKRYEIPGGSVLPGLASLRQMNIMYGTLFPDLDGAAVEANMYSTMIGLGSHA